jgi:SSS family solute:Na+ symporter
MPNIVDLSMLAEYGFAARNPESAIFEIPFIDRMGFVFVIVSAVMIVISLLDKEGKNNPKGLEIDAEMFKPKGAFAVGAVAVCGIIAALYLYFW